MEADVLDEELAVEELGVDVLVVDAVEDLLEVFGEEVLDDAGDHGGLKI